MALTSSAELVAWLTGFANYIDEIFTQYNGGNFRIKKSWHVTTKLVMALIQDVGQPLMKAMNSFQADNTEKISRVIFYAVLCSLTKNWNKGTEIPQQFLLNW